MNREIDDAARAEIADLRARYGPTLSREETLPDFRLNTWRPEGSEVCMVIRRHGDSLLVLRKTFYPRSAFRLPTGGIEAGEAVLEALRRETQEETGFEVEVKRLLCLIRYRLWSAGGTRVFYTFAFLMDQVDDAFPNTTDPNEQVDTWRYISMRELGEVADQLERIRGRQGAREPGDWPAWGRFRAVAHRAVADALGA